MKNIHKVLVGLIVAAAVAIPLAFVVTAGQPTEPTTQIVRIASGATPTPTPLGVPCHGAGC